MSARGREVNRLVRLVGYCMLRGFAEQDPRADIHSAPRGNWWAKFAHRRSTDYPTKPASVANAFSGFPDTGTTSFLHDRDSAPEYNRLQFCPPEEGPAVSDDPSVTHWLQNLQGGDPTSAQQLWARYFQQLVRLASGKLPGHVRREFDEEDVALSAFHSFLAGVQEGRFPQLRDRDDLWALLVVITHRKALAYLRHRGRHKRGGGQVLGESGVNLPDAGGGLDALIGTEPSPAFAAQVAEECERLLSCLEDEALRAIAVMKMQGYTVAEIAEQQGSTRRTVERRLQIIRKKWAAAADEDQERAP